MSYLCRPSMGTGSEMSGLFWSFNMRKNNKRKAAWTCFGVSQGSSFEYFLGHDISSSNTGVFWFSWDRRKSLWEKPRAAATTTIRVYPTAWPTMLISCKRPRGKRVGGTGIGKAATKIEQTRNSKWSKNSLYSHGNFLKNPFGCNGKRNNYLYDCFLLKMGFCFNCFFHRNISNHSNGFHRTGVKPVTALLVSLVLVSTLNNPQPPTSTPPPPTLSIRGKKEATSFFLGSAHSFHLKSMLQKCHTHFTHTHTHPTTTTTATTTHPTIFVHTVQVFPIEGLDPTFAFRPQARCEWLPSFHWSIFCPSL